MTELNYTGHGFYSDMAVLEYESQMKRENELISEAGRLQIVLAVLSCAAMLALPICLRYTDIIPKIIYILLPIALLGLLGSLVLCSIAQWHWRTRAFPDLTRFHAGNEETEKEFIETVARAQMEVARLNGRRSCLIRSAIFCFWTAMLTAIAFVIVGIVYMAPHLV